jgi:hypothetical protein
MKSFIQFTHANTQENTTAAILKFKKKDEERDDDDYYRCRSHINK